VGKPVVIHVRDAHDDCVEVLRSEGMREGMIHCFTGDTDAARKYLDLGFFISISGVVTYKKSEALQAAVAFTPLERLMIETDSPFLAPIPFRGKKNEPRLRGRDGQDGRAAEEPGRRGGRADLCPEHRRAVGAERRRTVTSKAGAGGYLLLGFF
jgi:hypothetical protein